MPRQARLDYPGALHHVIGRGIERKHIFDSDAYKSEFYRRISVNLSKCSIQCYAWCIMGNHFHLLLQTGKTTVAEFMRRVLTGYAVYYNRKNKRSGYLFQNRYKSVLCDQDEYLLVLMRYIHLNPVKAKMIRYQDLERYSWTGHREICRGEDGLIQRKSEVLAFWGKRTKEAIISYKDFVKEGLKLREDFEGGGLIRSGGGKAEVSKRRGDEREQYDERILGNGDFVREVYEITEETDEISEKIKSKDKLLKRLSWYYKTAPRDILKSRVKEVRKAREMYVYMGQKYLGLNLAEIGRELGIGRAAASLARKRAQENDKIEKKIMARQTN